jgi:hypothetical protein
MQHVWGEKKCIQENLSEGYHLEDPGVNGKLTLKRIFGK